MTRFGTHHGDLQSAPSGRFEPVNEPIRRFGLSRSSPRAAYDEVGRMSSIIAFPIKSPIMAEAEGLPDHIGAMQAKMFLAVFELRDSINELTRLVETDETLLWQNGRRLTDSMV